MVTDVDNSRLSNPAPISRSVDRLSVLFNALDGAVRGFRLRLPFTVYVVSLCVAALLYALFTKGVKPIEVEKALVISMLPPNTA
jgi:hypothetical protein